MMQDQKTDLFNLILSQMQLTTSGVRQLGTEFTVISFVPLAKVME